MKPIQDHLNQEDNLLPEITKTKFMTKDQYDICKALYLQVKYFPGSWDKRIGTTLYYLDELSEKQNEWMYRLLYKYRRQLPALYDKHKDNPLCSRLTKTYFK
jgi:hypothetical protein